MCKIAGSEGIRGFFKGWTIWANFIFFESFIEAFHSMYKDTNGTLSSILGLAKVVKTFGMNAMCSARMIGYTGAEFSNFEIYSGLLFGTVGILNY